MKDYFIDMDIWNDVLDAYEKYDIDMSLLKRIEEAYKSIPRFPNVVKRLGVL